MGTRAPFPVYGRVLQPEDAERQRQLYCANYNACLTLAVSADWPGFHCTLCKAFKPLTREEFKQDLDALGDLLGRMSQVSQGADEEALPPQWRKR